MNTLEEMNAVIQGQKFDADEALIIVNRIRKEASETEKGYRTKLGLLTAEAFTMYCNMMDAGGEGRTLLYTLKVEVEKTNKLREDTKDASIFVRYVFAAMDHKAVSVMSKVIEYARGKTSDLVQYLKDNGGLEGVRTLAIREERGDDEPEPRGLEGQKLIANAVTLTKIDVKDWEPDEKLRVYIAVKQKDGTTLLKDTCFDSDRVAEVMHLYGSLRKAIKADANKTLETASTDEKKQGFMLKNRVINAKQHLDNLEYDISNAVAKGDRRALVQLRTERAGALLKLAEARAEQNDLRKARIA
ncbi:hypothetical protein [Variovorax sp. LG9.2]|uniref:hypothetical protein n=2 Tax=Burkholderiales TaxID=80840 RepID=UPI002B233635|nr:hypothetical protein [Variovorax sp. LG9.2]MEB0057301.1 hypothetical protein [Variovorax sp. LG9.2]